MPPDEETKTLLRENLRISRENYKILRKMRRDAFVGRIFSILVWLVVLGLPVAIYYYFLSPILGDVLHLYESIGEGVDNVQNIPDQLSWLQSIIDKLSGGTGSTTGQ